MKAMKNSVLEGKVMIVAEANKDSSPWVQSALKELSNTLPQFKTKAEAIKTLNSELETLATNRSLSVADLLKLASSSVENHEDLDKSLRLSSLIYSLKNC